MKDENDKEGDFLDDFETLLFEEDGVDDQQLALNDSFEEFEKKENSVKDIEILAEMNRRK